MILCSFQPKEWKEYKNPRYSKIKEIIGIPKDKNIYWFFSGRTPEEANINAYTVTANVPYYFVMADTDNYIKVDKIKWLQLAESEVDIPLTKEKWEDITTIENEAAVEYILVGVPENYAEVAIDLDGYKDFYYGCENNESGKFAHLISNSLTYIAIRDKIVDAIIETTHSICMSFTDENEKQKECIGNLLAFNNVYFLLSYYIGCAYLTQENSAVKEYEELYRVFMLPRETVDFAKEYALFCMSAPHKDYKTLCDELLDLQKRIFKKQFYLKSGFALPLDNKLSYEKCFCGSGAVLKDCCGKDFDPDIYKIMTCDKSEYERKRLWIKRQDDRIHALGLDS